MHFLPRPRVWPAFDWDKRPEWLLVQNRQTAVWLWITLVFSATSDFTGIGKSQYKIIGKRGVKHCIIEVVHSNIFRLFWMTMATPNYSVWLCSNFEHYQLLLNAQRFCSNFEHCAITDNAQISNKIILNNLA